MFGRAPGTAGLVCLIRADSLAESNWTRPSPTATIFGSAVGQTTTTILLRTEAAAIKLDSHFLQPRQPGASGRQDRAEFVDDHLFSNSDCGVFDPPQEVT